MLANPVLWNQALFFGTVLAAILAAVSVVTGHIPRDERLA
jgi:hypothetical protein